MEMVHIWFGINSSEFLFVLPELTLNWKDDEKKADSNIYRRIHDGSFISCCIYSEI